MTIDKLPSPEPEEPALWEHFNEEQIAAVLEDLDPGFRRVFELHTMGYAYKEIARELDISIKTVGTRLFRARTKLKEILLGSRLSFEVDSGHGCPSNEANNLDRSPPVDQIATRGEDCLDRLFTIHPSQPKTVPVE